ncbi:MAG: SdiA-regulated domain-containing protein [Saprospiraceae bacterium]|nr:SdiA-regulated domain-containing protein [Saprospiraceae bacterium]
MRYLLMTLLLAGTLAGLYFIQTKIVQSNIATSNSLEKETIQGFHAYRINQPDQTILVPEELKKISGLTFSEDKFLLAIEDENGIIYYLNKKTGLIDKKVKFGKADDYEGITTVGRNIYIITSKGDIFNYDTLGQTTKYETKLSAKYDIEGLYYVTSKQHLLIACKRSGPNTKSYERKVFNFNLVTMTLLEEPGFTIDCREIANRLGQSKNAPYFSPSAICMDQADNLYLISSTSKAIIVLNPEGQIKSVAKLDRTLHVQPEGIAIDKNGILYIANEGRGTSPKVYVFNPKI